MITPSTTSRRHAQRKRSSSSHQSLRRALTHRLSVEQLEDRRVLAAVVTAASAGAFSAVATFLDCVRGYRFHPTGRCSESTPVGPGDWQLFDLPGLYGRSKRGQHLTADW